MSSRLPAAIGLLMVYLGVGDVTTTFYPLVTAVTQGAELLDLILAGALFVVAIGQLITGVQITRGASPVLGATVWCIGGGSLLAAMHALHVASVPMLALAGVQAAAGPLLVIAVARLMRPRESSLRVELAGLLIIVGAATLIERGWFIIEAARMALDPQVTGGLGMFAGQIVFFVWPVVTGVFALRAARVLLTASRDPVPHVRRWVRLVLGGQIVALPFYVAGVLWTSRDLQSDYVKDWVVRAISTSVLGAMAACVLPLVVRSLVSRLGGEEPRALREVPRGLAWAAVWLAPVLLLSLIGPEQALYAAELGAGPRLVAAVGALLLALGLAVLTDHRAARFLSRLAAVVAIGGFALVIFHVWDRAAREMIRYPVTTVGVLATLLVTLAVLEGRRDPALARAVITTTR